MRQSIDSKIYRILIEDDYCRVTLALQFLALKAALLSDSLKYVTNCYP